MRDSYIFTFASHAREIETEWRAWYCTGDVWASKIICSNRTVIGEHDLALQNTAISCISPADSLGCRLTDLYLALMEVAEPMIYRRCISCKSAFRSFDLKALPANTELRQAESAENGMCKLCAARTCSSPHV